MNRQAVARELVKVARSLVAGEIVLATNSSYHSWEDFSDTRTAKVYLDEDNYGLRLEIVGETRDTGINPSHRKAVLEDVNIGTLEKPKLGPVPSLLKKHGHERSRAGGPFKSDWVDRDNRKAPLGTIIRNTALKFEPAPAAPEPVETKSLPTENTAETMRYLLKNVDLATIEVENATDKAAEAIKTGDKSKIDYALGFLESVIDNLVRESETYKKLVKQIS